MISQQTSSNFLVFVLEMDCVLFKLGTEFLNKVLAHMDLIVRPVLVRAFSSQPVTRRPVSPFIVIPPLHFILLLTLSLSEGRLVAAFGCRGVSDGKLFSN